MPIEIKWGHNKMDDEEKVLSTGMGINRSMEKFFSWILRVWENQSVWEDSKNGMVRNWRKVKYQDSGDESKSWRT